ncbi:hypothetical protein [Cupriavidus basilensis]|uniref:hypothetical protein n=1 Tax=Cupriavidus basilensis TaxID=68895 RepID=UPI0039F6C7D8
MFGISLAGPLAKTLGIVALVLALLAAGFYLGARHYAPQVAALDQKLGAAGQALADSKVAYSTLAAAAAVQNATIAALQKADAARAAVAASAVAAASAQDVQKQARAVAILAAKPAPGLTQCAAASALIDAQIKMERP